MIDVEICLESVDTQLFISRVEDGSGSWILAEVITTLYLSLRVEIRTDCIKKLNSTLFYGSRSLSSYMNKFATLITLFLRNEVLLDR